MHLQSFWSLTIKKTGKGLSRLSSCITRKKNMFRKVINFEELSHLLSFEP